MVASHCHKLNIEKNYLHSGTQCTTHRSLRVLDFAVFPCAVLCRAMLGYDYYVLHHKINTV